MEEVLLVGGADFAAGVVSWSCDGDMLDGDCSGGCCKLDGGVDIVGGWFMLREVAFGGTYVKVGRIVVVRQ